MRYNVHKIANVRSIENVDLLTHLWYKLIESGVRFPGYEPLIYMIDTRGDVWVVINPRPSRIQNMILQVKHGDSMVILSSKDMRPDIPRIEYDESFEIQSPDYYEVLIEEYSCLVKCTEFFTDEQLDSLGSVILQNAYSEIRKKNEICVQSLPVNTDNSLPEMNSDPVRPLDSIDKDITVSNVAHMDHIIKVTELCDGSMRDKCIDFIKRIGWPIDRSFLMKKEVGSEETKFYICLIPARVLMGVYEESN